MFAIVCRRKSWVRPKESILLHPQFLDPQIAVFVKLFSSKILPSPGVCRNDSEKSFTASYLINSCGLSSEDALSLSEKVCIKSYKKPDAVLELFRKYGFTNADIIRLVNNWPSVLKANPEKTLLPKLEFFCSVGIPLPGLVEILSFNPTILQRSLKNRIIPSYNTLKGVVQSDKIVAKVLLKAKRRFNSIPTSIGLLRKLGLPESSIAWLVTQKPHLVCSSEKTLAASVDRAVKMGFDKAKPGITLAIEVFTKLSESTLKRKMEVYRMCGLSESDVDTAFSKFPICMQYSEKKIVDNMDFLVNKMSVKPAAVAQNPFLLGFSLEKRMKPRFLIARILNAKGLKKMVTAISLLTITEKMFMKRYIVDYQNYIPQLLDLYRGKLSLEEMGFTQDVIEKIQSDFKEDNFRCRPSSVGCRHHFRRAPIGRIHKHRQEIVELQPNCPPHRLTSSLPPP